MMTVHLSTAVTRALFLGLAWLVLLAAGGVAEATDATVTITDLNQVYNGQPKPVTVTTDPVGLSVLVTYNGSNTVPSQPGSYNVVATVTATNYRGSGNATEVISSSSGSSTTSPTSATATATSASTGGTATAGDTSSSSSGPCGSGAGTGGALGVLLALVAWRPRRR